jgi:3-methyladenine DNA glycosylase AlkD
MLSLSEAEAFFTERFSTHSDPVRATEEQRYHKSTRRFYGCGAKVIHAANKDFARSHSSMNRDEVLALAAHLFAIGTQEHCCAAIGTLEHFGALLVAEDAAFLIGLARASQGWGLIDWLSIKVVGPLLDRFPTLHAAQAQWSKDADFWVRRVSVLAFIPSAKAGKGDWTRFSALVVPLLPEKEFFIRKAIGWTLREWARRDEEAVFAFLLRHRAAASGLTVREGAKHFPSARRLQLGLRA